MLKKLIIQDPIVQGFIIVILMLLALIVFRIVERPIAGWNSSALFVLLYCLLNPIAGFFVKKIGKYVLKSVFMFLLLFFFSISLSSFITGMSYDEFGENAMIYLPSILYFPIALLLMAGARLLRKTLVK